MIFSYLLRMINTSYRLNEAEARRLFLLLIVRIAKHSVLSYCA